MGRSSKYPVNLSLNSSSFNITGETLAVLNPLFPGWRRGIEGLYPHPMTSLGYPSHPNPASAHGSAILAQRGRPQATYQTGSLRLDQHLWSLETEASAKELTEGASTNGPFFPQFFFGFEITTPKIDLDFLHFSSMTSIYRIYRWCSTATQLLTCSENGNPGCEHVVAENSPGKYRHDSADKVKLSYMNKHTNRYSSSRDIQKHIFKNAPTTTNYGKQVSDMIY